MAIYAAIVATLALAWQVVSWIREHRTSVRVRVRRVFLDTRQWARPAVEVRVYNSSQHPVRVIRFGLYSQQDGDTPLALVYGSGGSIPGIVVPNDVGSGYFALDHLETYADSSQPIVGFVVLADYEARKSDPVTLQ